MNTKERHDTVGRMFRMPWNSETARCIKWEGQTGFFFRIESIGEDSHRTVGQIVDTSERAIGRTIHRIDDDDSYEEHAMGCECRVCWRPCRQ